MSINDLKSKMPKGQPAGDGTLILLLSLNFLLLAFFILLNGMATRESEHSSKVWAKMREGYDVAGPLVAGQGEAVPLAPASRWSEDMRGRVRGVVINRLQIDTIPLEVDGERLIMRFPAEALFGAGGKVSDPELVRNLMAAAGSEAAVTWEIGGDLRQSADLARRMANLAELTGEASVGDGEDEVKVTFRPGSGTKPSVAGTMQRLSLEAGATDVRAEKDVRPERP